MTMKVNYRWGILAAIMLLVCAETAYSIEIKRYVKPGGTGNGTTWENACGSINTAINAVFRAGSGTVYVAGGSYNELIEIPAEASDITLLGSIIENDSGHNSNFRTHATIIKGERSGCIIDHSTSNIKISKFWFYNGTGIKSNAKNALKLDSIAVSNVKKGEAAIHFVGYGKDMEIKNCFIGDNDVTGIIAKNTRITFTYVYNNKGGGMYLTDCEVVHCSIYGNSRDDMRQREYMKHVFSGGGISMAGTSVQISNIHDNFCYGNGGGIFIRPDGQTSSHIYSSLIHNNTADNGGGIYVQQNLALESSTVVLNHAHKAGGGVYIGDVRNDLLKWHMTGSILWANVGRKGYDQFAYDKGKNIFLTSSAIQGGGLLPEIDAKEGIIDLSSSNIDEQKSSVRFKKVGDTIGARSDYFSDESFQNFALQPGSVCIDKGGSYDELDAFRTYDVYLDSRTVNRIDIGAAEFQTEQEEGTEEQSEERKPIKLLERFDFLNIKKMDSEGPWPISTLSWFANEKNDLVKLGLRGKVKRMTEVNSSWGAKNETVYEFSESGNIIGVAPDKDATRTYHDNGYQASLNALGKSFVFNDQGQLSSIKDMVYGARTRDFTYSSEGACVQMEKSEEIMGGDTDVSTHKYTYNKHGDIVKETIVGKTVPPDYAKVRGEKPKPFKYEHTYTYTYDQHGNWTSWNGHAMKVVRKIEYY